MILSFVQTKGGTGKSTLALCTAFSSAMARRFGAIALVELDPQGTLGDWWREREEAGRGTGNVSFHHITSTQKAVLQEGIRSVAAHNDLLIMDIPGESTGRIHTQFACALSDRVIIPLRISINDESAFAGHLMPIIREIVKLAPEKRRNFHVLPAFTHPQAGRRKIGGYFNAILPAETACLDAVFPARSVYENFNRDGLHLTEYVRSVGGNKRMKRQAEQARADVETIAKTILRTWETPHGSTPKAKKARSEVGKDG